MTKEELKILEILRKKLGRKRIFAFPRWLSAENTGLKWRQQPWNIGERHITVVGLK